MLQFRRRCCSAVWASARSAASTSRFTVTRYTHSQAHQSRVEHDAQYQQKHGEGFWVSRVDGFRYVSAAEPHASTGTSSGVPGHDVVVCIGWMGCKEKHLDQVARTWLSLSPTASIITYRPSPMDVLWPRTGVETAERLVASLPQGCRVVVHGFSTGGYLYSLMMQSLVKRKGLGHCRISGCVFDCAVDMEGIAVGMGHAVSKNGIGQAVVRSLTSIYLFLMYPVVTHLYIKASNLFKNPPAELKVPVYFPCSVTLSCFMSP